MRALPTSKQASSGERIRRNSRGRCGDVCGIAWRVLGNRVYFTEVHETSCRFEQMATGVFGYARGHGLRGYSNANGLFLRYDEFMNTTILERDM